FVPQAESGGLMPTLDNLLVFRCVQIARRLAVKNREVGLFSNLSATTLVSIEVFREVCDFLAANRALASSLIFQFPQATVRAMGPIELESMAALIELGFRFCMDRVGDLRVDPRDLADRGFRFVKLAAPLLLSRASSPT